MLKRSLIVAICLFQLLFLSCKNESAVTIKGEIANLESPYILVTYISADTLTVDTITINNAKGHFSFEAAIDTFTVITLFMNDHKSTAVVFANRGDQLTIKGDALMPDLLRINGSVVNDELTAFKRENETLLVQRQQLARDLTSFSGDTNSLRITPFALNEEMMRLAVLNRELQLRAEEHIESHPTQMSSLVLINDLFTDNDNPETLDRMLALLQGDVLHTRLARRLQFYSEIINTSAVGMHVPSFELIDVENDTIHSHDFSGKYTLLSFVSSSDNQSRQLVEQLKESYVKMNEDSIQFITIYIDSETLPVQHLAADSLSWTVVSEARGWGSQVVNKLNVQRVPFNILISPEGIISDRDILVEEVENALKMREKMICLQTN